MPDEPNHSARERPLREEGKTGSPGAFTWTRPPKRPIENLPPELTGFVGRGRQSRRSRGCSQKGPSLLTLCVLRGRGQTRSRRPQDAGEGFEDGAWLGGAGSAPPDPELAAAGPGPALGVRECRVVRSPTRSWSI